MPDLFTHGRWLVRGGREDQFVAAWRELAEWTASNVAGAGWAYLLQDGDDDRSFASFGPWESADAIAAWRSTAGFRERVERMQELLDSFEPRVLNVRAHVGEGA
jgi:heme-degrading monooxygenase HmoA